MMRGNGGNDIFFSPADRTRYLLLLQEGVERYGHRIHAYCLMDNHTHLLIQVGEISLSRIMQNLSFRYTRFVNRQQKRVGHLFQGRFKAILIDEDTYLLQLTRYIHLNPVRVGLCQLAKEYEWSSHLGYMGSVSTPWLHTEEILARFFPDVDRAKSMYAEFINQGMHESRREEFHTGSHSGLILGDDHFAERALVSSGCPGVAEQPSVTNIINLVCAEFGIGEDDIKAAGKQRISSEARAMVALITQNTEGVTLTELGQVLNRELSSLSQAAGRLNKRAKDDQALKDMIMRIKNSVQIPICQA
ncbi:MAG: transposase [Mariprofundaceae bacterium]|nr:transposase [Mariprofundaceae bacterium]